MSDEFNRTSSSSGSSGASWDSTSNSTQGGVARVRDEAARQGSAALDSLKQGARSLSEEAKDRAAGYVEEGKGAVTEHLDAFAQAIRKASDELSEKDETMAAQVVRQAASGLESLSRSIGGTSFSDMIDSVRSFGRRNPTAFVAGAALVGLALGRFARASGHRDDEDDWRGGRADWDDGYAGGGQYGGGYSGGSEGNWRRTGSGGGSGSSYSGSSYPAGSRAATAPSTFGGADTPPRSQGYAGGGMGKGSTQFTSTPSSETDESLSSSSFSGGGAQPGSISTGDKS